MDKIANAVRKVNAQLLRKKAGVLSDMFGGLPAGMIAGAIPGGALATTAADVGGLIHGASSDAPTEEELKRMNKDWGESFIPGVGVSRMLRRAKKVAKGSKNGTGNIAGEYIGGVTASMLPILATTIAGGIIGGMVGKKHLTGYQDSKYSQPMTSSEATAAGAGGGALSGALVGAGGVGLAKLIGALSAAGTARRTKAEQRAHDDATNVSNWLIPGVAEYNKWKRVGRMIAEDEEEARKTGKRSKR